MALQQLGVSADGLDQVISILLTMMKDFRTQMEGDKASWEGYSSWSDSEEQDKTSFIQEQEALVMSKNALKSANQDAVQKLTGEISTLSGDILSTKKSIAELTKLRKEEHYQHEEELADLTKTIDAVNKAIEILEGHYSASGAALSEIKKRVQYALSLSDNGNDKSQSTLTNLIQQAGPDWLSVDGSKSYGSYESQAGGGGVVGTLNDLRSTLDQNKQESIEKENESRRTYEDTKASKEAEISRMTEELGNKKLAKTNAESTITSCTAAIDGATTNIADGKAFLQVLLADREKFQKEFNERTVMRNDEMAATQAALDALQAVSAGAKSGVGAASSAFLQVSSKGRTRSCPKCEKETAKLLQLSQKLHSAELIQVVSELTQRQASKALYSPDGFEPVKELLRKLIERLEEEQSAETSHHDWCETEKSSSEQAQRDREKTIKDLQTEVEFLTTNTAQLKTELTFLADEFDRVKYETEEATRIRNEAHEVFAKAKADHDEVIGAIEKAMEALGDKYSLLQKQTHLKRHQNVMKARTNLWAEHKSQAKAKDKSKAKGSPFADYQSGSGSAGSATEMLEDLLSRYSAARTQLVGDEEAAVAAYKQLMAANKQFMKDTQNTLNSKMSERRGKLNKMNNAKIDLKTNFVELQEVGTYLQDLRPSCDDIRSTFEERKRRREAEIAALKECLEVLSDPSAMSDV
jgi:DNA repair exonuclease SbcCD ATPase subunit